MKRTLSFLLSLVMIFLLIPGTTVCSVTAELAEPATSNTVTINDGAELAALLGDGKAAENTRYVLAADVDLGGADVTATPFILKNSVFDGGDHTITGFTMDSAGVSASSVGSSYMGLFRLDPSQDNTVVIKNLKLGSADAGIVIVNRNWGWASGALLGMVPAGVSCRIENVDAFVNYTHTGANGGKIAGALLGYTEGTLEMDYCTSNGTVYCLLSEDNPRGVGGLIGWVKGGEKGISTKSGSDCSPSRG